MPTLPVDGQSGWGDILNAYITALSTEANTTQSNLTNHSANTPADPHGDRSYAQSLVNPIINGVNLPNGFVQLNSQGLIPPSLISGGGTSNSTGGMFNGIFDAVATYGAVAGTGADQSSKIQAALNAAGTAGGGIVWLGPGVFSLSNYLVMPSNTHLMMSEATVLQRISGSPNSNYLITNVQFGTSNTPSTDIKISGGKIDSVGSGGLTSQCTPVFLIQSNKNSIENVYFNNVFSNPAVEINGCVNTIIQNCYFDGTGSNLFFSFSNAPAVRINVSATTTTPTGLSNTFYNNTLTVNCRLVNSNTVATAATNGCYGALIATDLTNANHSKNIFVTGCSTMYSSSLGNAVVSNGCWTGIVNSNNLFV